MRAIDVDYRLRLGLRVVDAAFSDYLGTIAEKWRLTYDRAKPADAHIVYTLSDRVLGEIGQFSLREMEDGEISFKVRGPDTSQQSPVAMQPDDSALQRTIDQRREKLMQEMLYYLQRDGLFAKDQQRWERQRKGTSASTRKPTSNSTPASAPQEAPQRHQAKVERMRDQVKSKPLIAKNASYQTIVDLFFDGSTTPEIAAQVHLNAARVDNLLSEWRRLWPKLLPRRSELRSLRRGKSR
jgi:hypothetical protein